MHLATAIRYGANGFITMDRRLLNKAHAIAAAYDGFRVLAPETAVVIAERFVLRTQVTGNK